MRYQYLSIYLLCCFTLFASGCASSRNVFHAAAPDIGDQSCEDEIGSPVLLVNFDEEAKGEPEALPSLPSAAYLPGESLEILEQLAASHNPRLMRLQQQYQAAVARTQFADKLPDPKLGANIFGNPIETAAGSQRANLSISQSIPWLDRLNAQQQRACCEAYAILAEYKAERLKVVAAVRTVWFRLYVIDKQIEIADANKILLKSLIEVANAKISNGKATQGDVLLGTLELSKLEERLLTYRRQRTGLETELNRLLARPANTPISSVEKLPVQLPVPDANEVYQIALNNQPEIEAAQLRVQATHWGIEVARLSRRPEFTLSTSYFFTDNNRAPNSFVNVGEDPWAIGAQMSIPIWREKYNAMENEAAWQHQAAQSTVKEIADRYDSKILDIFTEADRAIETAQLYEATILPQAKQTLASDQKAYATGGVEFDRLVRDFRNLLTLEFGYHQAIGDLSIANTRLRQAAGWDIPLASLAIVDATKNEKKESGESRDTENNGN